MRRVSWDEHKKRIEAKLRKEKRFPWEKRRTVANVRRRPRNPRELEALMCLDRAHWKRAIAEGRLQKLGPRRFKLNG